MDCSPTRLLCPRDFPGKNAGVIAISFSRGFSQPGFEPMSPALAGEFFTTEPPGKPKTIIPQLKKKKNEDIFPLENGYLHSEHLYTFLCILNSLMDF